MEEYFTLVESIKGRITKQYEKGIVQNRIKLKERRKTVTTFVCNFSLP